MIMRCKITKKIVVVKFFLIPLKPLKNFSVA